ncbi:hypothetical protein ACFPOE_13475 [Caenimonas terrae]|uniref:DUF998 domain-containing protein n=1 Tax=Caenimonas terrae TaxID=696074 RepID=A0ABW0NF18_9BURK
MKTAKFSVVGIFLIYLATLGLTVLLTNSYPESVDHVLRAFFPADESGSAFVRYRMALFLTATCVFLLVAPALALFGTSTEDRERINRTPTWQFVVALLFIPVGWAAFPVIALCDGCWTQNDIFYFFLTLLFFVGLQLLLQAIWLKLKSRMGD